MIRWGILFGVFAAMMFVPVSSSADIGNCVRYEVVLKTANQSALKGFMQVRSYDPMIEANGKKLLELIRDRRLKAATVFKTIRTIEYRQGRTWPCWNQI